MADRLVRLEAITYLFGDVSCDFALLTEGDFFSSNLSVLRDYAPGFRAYT
jgi:hypothetical protein